MSAIEMKIALLWRRGYDTLDIAEALNLSESDVYNALSRARQKQREVAA